ncbi:MAG: hypothetical protein E6Z15_23415, partial [Paenibacillus macerans]|nr:hypothetical protein [Paenibacillus macerans]
RTLIRKGGPAALELFGYAAPSAAKPVVSSASLTVEPAALRIGDSCELRYALTVREGDPVKVRVEYGIDFVKAGGKTSRKLFLLADKTVPGGASIGGARRHSWADLTTRRHYSGAHRITLLVNGAEAAAAVLQLEAAAANG